MRRMGHSRIFFPPCFYPMYEAGIFIKKRPSVSGRHNKGGLHAGRHASIHRHFPLRKKCFITPSIFIVTMKVDGVVKWDFRPEHAGNSLDRGEGSFDRGNIASPARAASPIAWIGRSVNSTHPRCTPTPAPATRPAPAPPPSPSPPPVSHPSSPPRTTNTAVHSSSRNTSPKSR